MEDIMLFALLVELMPSGANERSGLTWR